GGGLARFGLRFIALTRHPAGSEQQSCGENRRAGHELHRISSGGFGVLNVNRAFRCRENAPQHRLEEFERGALIVGIERGLVVKLAKAGGTLEMRMTAERLAHVAIEPDVMEEIIALE